MKRIISQEQRGKVMSNLYDQGLGHIDKIQMVIAFLCDKSLTDLGSSK